MRVFLTLRLLLLSLWLAGCASYPRFPDESNLNAPQLMKDFGLGANHVVVGPENLIGNTLRSENKTFVTDKTVQKRYFGDQGRVFFQSGNLIAYGFIPIPTGSGSAKGDVDPFRFVRGVFVISVDGCDEPERILVTTEKGSGEYTCWTSGCRSELPIGWSKGNCAIEQGNTLQLGTR